MNGKSKSVSDRIKSIVSGLNFDELVDQTEAKYNMKSSMDSRRTYTKSYMQFIVQCTGACFIIFFPYH